MTKDCRSNFKWCIDNDFQVYVKPMNHSKNFKIAIRKGGISTNGKSSFYSIEKNMTIYSNEILGSVLYKNQSLAIEALPIVYNYLKKTYDKKRVVFHESIKNKNNKNK